MLDQERCGIGGHDTAMAWSRAMSKRKAEQESKRSCRPCAAGELVGAIGDRSFRRFGFIQSSIVSRWADIVGDRYAKVSSPESIRFPTGKKGGGALTLLVDGAHAPLIQHLTPMIVERVNRFFGYAAINRIVLGPCPRRWAKDCARSPTLSFVHVWSRLRRELPLAMAPLPSTRAVKPSP